MSYFKPATKEQVLSIRDETGLSKDECIDLAHKKNALDAIEDCRVDASLPYSKVNHTILDMLQYLIQRN